MPARPLSTYGLQQLHDTMNGYFQRGEIPGIVTLVTNGDDVRVDTIGMMDLETHQPMRRDTIFRIASMTKAITAVAMMMLLEEGALSLDDPAEKWLPELANRRVLKRLDGPVDDTVPANRAITVRDLMTMRAGYGAIMGAPSQYPIQHVLEEHGIAPGADLSSISHDEYLQRFADVPLLHQPGDEWHYDTASDMLGILISRLTREPLRGFLLERIIWQLRMEDTDFHVPEEKLDRLATAYTVDKITGELSVMDPARDDLFTTPPVFESGAGGLVSTVDDYLIFSRMLLNGGEYAGRRYISAASVEAMTTDHITRVQKDRSPFFPGFWDHAGWGYGVEVTTTPDDVSPVPGRYGWDGGYGTSWRNDPASGLIAMVFCQRLFSGPVMAMIDDFFKGAFATLPA